MKLEETFAAVASVSKSFVIFLDGLDLLIDVHQALTLDWLQNVPQVFQFLNIRFTVFSVSEACKIAYFKRDLLG